MAVVIDEVQVEAVETQAERGDEHAQAKKPGRQKLDPAELGIVLRQREQRLARLWAD